MLDKRSYGSFNDGLPKYKEDGRLHKLAGPRYRLVLPLRRPVSFVEFQALFEHLERLLALRGAKVDPATRNPSRIQFSPRINPAGPAPWFAVHPGQRLLDPDALPDGKSGTASICEAVARKEAEERQQKEDRRRRWEELQTGSTFDRRQLAEGKQRALAILERKLAELVGGACRTKEGDLGSRNLSVYHLGATVARFAHYFTADEVEALRDRVIAAAEASGITKDIERQYDNGFAEGETDGPTVFGRRKTTTTDRYCGMYDRLTRRLLEGK